MVDPTMDQNFDLKEKLTRVLDRATQDAIALLVSHRENQQPSAEPIPDWMTASQLARYWQLVNADGETLSTWGPVMYHPHPSTDGRER